MQEAHGKLVSEEYKASCHPGSSHLSEDNTTAKYAALNTDSFVAAGLSVGEIS